jgi:hypothetical protein
VSDDETLLRSALSNDTNLQTGWQLARLRREVRARRQRIWHAGHAPPPASMKHLAGCFFVKVAALRFLSAGAAIGAKSTASEPVHRSPVGLGNGRRGGVIRQLPVVVLCTLNEVAYTVPAVDP